MSTAVFFILFSDTKNSVVVWKPFAIDLHTTRKAGTHVKPLNVKIEGTIWCLDCRTLLPWISVNPISGGKKIFLLECEKRLNSTAKESSMWKVIHSMWNIDKTLYWSIEIYFP